MLVHLYPRAWRHRYGEEFEEVLLDSRGDLATALNIALAAIREHIFPTQGGMMDRESISFSSLVRYPSALIPMIMSLMALALVSGHIVLYGAVREADEGTTAHLWQILMAGQAPVLLFFAIKWIPRVPLKAFGVMALQVGSVLAAMAPVLYFNL
jgi:hypothetical protein